MREPDCDDSMTAVCPHVPSCRFHAAMSDLAMPGVAKAGKRKREASNDESNKAEESKPDLLPQLGDAGTSPDAKRQKVRCCAVSNASIPTGPDQGM